jgi:isoprenylcysteine carboxyl methyltransferase (ICMT) family protein YpbQ
VVVDWVLLCVIACERVAELVVSSRHAKHLLARGGVEDGFGHFPVMFVLHVALIAGCVVEPLLGHRAFVPALGWTMLAVTVAANVLRWWCISTLGSRWAARVIVLPGAPLVRSGPYRSVGLPGRADRRGARRGAGPGGGPRPLPRGRPARRLRAGLAEGLRPAWRLTAGLLWSRNQPLLASRLVPAAQYAPWLFSTAVNHVAQA